MTTEEGRVLVGQLSQDAEKEQQKIMALMCLLGRCTREEIDTDKELVSSGAMDLENTRL